MSSPEHIDQSEQIASMMRTRVLRVNAIALAVVVGLLLGLGLFATTNFLRLRDGPEAGPHLALLGQVFPGYRVSFLGSLAGFFWCFVAGFGATLLGAMIYNAIASYRARKWERS